MAEICFVRIDSRLLHGQVMTQWLQRSGASRIIIIDDDVASNEDLAMVFRLCSPCDVDIFSHQEAADQWTANAFGNGKVFLLFSNPYGALDTYEKGLKYSNLQVGGIGASVGSKLAHESIHLTPDQAKMIDKLSDYGVTISFQMATSSRCASWNDVRKKFL